MSFCTNCGTKNDDNATVCVNCGQPLTPVGQNTPGYTPETGAQASGTNETQPIPTPAPEPTPQPGPTPQAGPIPQAGPSAQPYPSPYAAQSFDPYDFTSEFDPADISANKCFALLPYLLGTIGIIIAALISKDSPYVTFHLRQAVKFVVVNILLGIIALVLSFTIIVPIAAGVCYVIIFVLKIIAVFQIFSGKAVEPAIIRNFSFLS